MSVDVKIGDDILYGASVVRLESATTPGKYEEFTLGGGGYPESVIADDTVTLVDSPAPITFVSGADQYTISAWKVKVNDIELEYIPEDIVHLKEVEGITYAVFLMGSDAALFVGDSSTEDIVAGSYTVNIVSTPTLHITENGLFDVSDISDISVDVQPHFNSRVETIELDSGSTASSISLDFFTVTDYNEIAPPSPSIVVSRGGSQTITLYDPTYSSPQVLIRSTVPMTSISGRNIGVLFSTDKTWACVYFHGSDSDYVVVS